MTDTIDWAARWEELAEAAPSKGEPPRYFRPLSDALEGFIREAKATHRIYTGIEAFDLEMRGVSDGHFCTIVGASHSGKTLAFMHMLRSNRDKRVALFVPDEPQTLILTKLATLTSGIPAKEIERAVAADDHDMMRMLRDVALEEFPNLVVFDKPLAAPEMVRAYNEACDHWGDKPDFVAFDYVELFPVADTVQGKFDWLKAFGAVNEVPVIALHQTSRSAGAEGRKITITSGTYGGEQHSTFMIGVRRKKTALMAELAELTNKFERSGSNSESIKEAIEALRYDLKIHEFTVTLNLVKNKRPGGSLVDDIDFELDTQTGRIYPLNPGDLPRQYLTSVRPQAAHAHVEFLDDDYQQMEF